MSPDPKAVREALLDALEEAFRERSGWRAAHETRVLNFAAAQLPSNPSTTDTWELLDGLAALHLEKLVAPGADIHTPNATPMSALPWIHPTAKGRALLNTRREKREREEKAKRAREAEKEAGAE